MVDALIERKRGSVAGGGSSGTFHEQAVAREVTLCC